MIQPNLVPDFQSKREEKQEQNITKKLKYLYLFLSTIQIQDNKHKMEYIKEVRQGVDAGYTFHLLLEN